MLPLLDLRYFAMMNLARTKVQSQGFISFAEVMFYVQVSVRQNINTSK